MPLFGRKKREHKGLLSELARDVELGKELQQEAMARAGVSMDTVRQLEAAAMQPGAVQAMQAYGLRVAHLYQAGVEHPATLRSIQVQPNALAPNGVTVAVQLTVEPAGGAPYEVSTMQVLAPAMAQALAAGQAVTVKVDPADPQSVMIWGTAAPGASPPAAASPPVDPAIRLAKLQALRDSGVLTEEEFQAQRARLAGS